MISKRKYSLIVSSSTNHKMFPCKKSFHSVAFIVVVVVITTALSISCKTNDAGSHGNLLATRSKRSLSSFIQNLQESTSRSFTSFTDLLPSISITKLILVSGALISVLFLFLRILVVIGPILILGAMAREDASVVDIVKIIVEGYNMIIEALDANQN